MNSKIKSSYDKPLFGVKQLYFTITQSTVYKDHYAQFDYKQIQTFLLTSQHLLNFYFLELLSFAHFFFPWKTHKRKYQGVQRSNLPFNVYTLQHIIIQTEEEK